MWYEKYVNIPYKTCNCAELLVAVWSFEFGTSVDYDKGLYLNLLANNQNIGIEELIVSHANLFQEIDEPIDKCAVLMYSRSGVVGHIGIYVDVNRGYVLHAHKNFKASVMQPKQQVFSLNPLYKYFKL